MVGVQMGAVERELLWAKDIIPRSGALSTSLGDSNAADWVAEFRCRPGLHSA